MYPIPIDMEPKVARCRLLISLIAIVAVYLDPTKPTLLPWLGERGEGFSIDPYALGVFCAHLSYSLAIIFALRFDLQPRARLSAFTTWGDVVFGALIMAVTEGSSSPFWAFFVFAVTAAGTYGGFRRSMAVTTVSVAFYLGLILYSWHGVMNFYLMRPVYLAVTGYLAAYLGQQRVNLQGEVHQLETAHDRNRIARALHDGCVQTLGGINLTLETCQHLVRGGRTAEALASLATLQAAINREHDDLRTYVRELAEVDPSPVARAGEPDTRFAINADFGGSAAFVEEVLRLVREAITNVRRHARAHAASVGIRTVDGQVLISVDDDGVGFSPSATLPWSISSTVTDAGGRIRVVRDRPGAHLRLALPEA
jgi:signal transduction histidine kinase